MHYCHLFRSIFKEQLVAMLEQPSVNAMLTPLRIVLNGPLIYMSRFLDNTLPKLFRRSSHAQKG